MMSYLTQREVLKKINGNPDCAAEFMLCNLEISMEDVPWAIQESNRTFKLHKLPFYVKDLCIYKKELLWKLQDTLQ